jgi:anamorsin
LINKNLKIYVRNLVPSKMNEYLKNLLKEATQSENTNNDEAYLKEEDKSVKKSAERSTVKKKCANCTCGMDNKPVENRVSACGGCHKGDAFRCSGCPYMGMPSFNEGDTIRFD